MTSPFESGLDEAQTCVKKLQTELAQPSSAPALEAVGTALYAQAFKLSALAEQARVATKIDRTLTRRVQQIAAMLASCQAQLARRAALNAQALHMLVPAARSTTYAAGLRGRAGQLYGSAGRQSGEFKAVSA